MMVWSNDLLYDRFASPLTLLNYSIFARLSRWEQIKPDLNAMQLPTILRGVTQKRA